MLDEPKESPRGIVQIAATISNGLLGVVLIAAGVLGLVAIAVAAADIADQTWVSLGAQITTELGTDVETLFETFQIDIAVILTTLADQNNLPEFGAWVRQILALLMVAAVALGLAGLLRSGLRAHFGRVARVAPCSSSGWPLASSARSVFS